MATVFWKKDCHLNERHYYDIIRSVFFLGGAVLIRILVDNLKPGMKLAQPVQNESGIVLLPKGAELTFSGIERLNAMGIASVMIEGKRVPPKPMEEVLEEIDARFKKTENEKHMVMLKKILIEHMNELYK